MKTYLQEIEDKKNECINMEELSKAYDWLANKYVEANEVAVQMERVICEKFGEKMLDDIIYESVERATNPLPENIHEIENKELAITLFDNGYEILLVDEDETKTAENIKEIDNFHGRVAMTESELERLNSDLLEKE